MKQGTKNLLLPAVLCATAMSCSPAWAQALMIEAYPAFSNPAEMSLEVKNFQIKAIDLMLLTNTNYTGTITPPTPLTSPIPFPPFTFPPLMNTQNINTATSDQLSQIPAFRVDKRLSDRFVVGLDFTKPYDANLAYPPQSALRYVSVNTNVNIYDLAPNLAVKISDKFSVGAGIDFLRSDANIQNVVPTPVFNLGTFNTQVIDQNFTINLPHTNSVGWHIGALYHLFRGTITGLSYYSPVNVNATGGTSTLNGGIFPTSYVPLSASGTLPAQTATGLSTTLRLPAVTTLSVLQFFSANWFIKADLRYVTWSRIQNVNVANTQFGTVSYGLNYRNTWEVAASSVYQITQPLALIFDFDYQETPTTPQSGGGGSIGIPGGGVDAYNFGVGFAYNFTKSLKVIAIGGHTFLGNYHIVDAPTATGYGLFGTQNTSSNNLRFELDYSI